MPSLGHMSPCPCGQPRSKPGEKCVDCTREYHRNVQRHYRQGDPETIRLRSLRKRREANGWTVALFALTWWLQKGRCAVCDAKLVKSQAEGTLFACADHDHATNRARGILCPGCNISVGHFEKMTKLRGRIETYLRKHGKDVSHLHP